MYTCSHRTQSRHSYPVTLPAIFPRYASEKYPSPVQSSPRPSCFNYLHLSNVRTVSVSPFSFLPPSTNSPRISLLPSPLSRVPLSMQLEPHRTASHRRPPNRVVHHYHYHYHRRCRCRVRDRCILTLQIPSHPIASHPSHLQSTYHTIQKVHSTTTHPNATRTLKCPLTNLIPHSTVQYQLAS